jgi:hypothetical protein
VDGGEGELVRSITLWLDCPGDESRLEGVEVAGTGALIIDA